MLQPDLLQSTRSTAADVELAAARDALCRLIEDSCAGRDRDLLQDVLMVCLRKFDAAPSRSSDVVCWARWARGVAWRLAFASGREKAHQRRAEAARSIRFGAAVRATPVDVAIGVERRDAVREALAALPPLMRTAVVRVDVLDEPYATVALDLYGNGGPTARQRLGALLHRARRKLRTALQSCAPEPRTWNATPEGAW